MTNNDDLESVRLVTEQDHDTPEYDHGHGPEFQEIRFRLRLATEIRQIRSNLGWSVPHMWSAVRDPDWRVFPYSVNFFYQLDRDPLAMARHLLRNPRLYDVIIALNDTHREE